MRVALNDSSRGMFLQSFNALLGRKFTQSYTKLALEVFGPASISSPRLSPKASTPLRSPVTDHAAAVSPLTRPPLSFPLVSSIIVTPACADF